MIRIAEIQEQIQPGLQRLVSWFKRWRDSDDLYTSLLDAPMPSPPEVVSDDIASIIDPVDDQPKGQWVATMDKQLEMLSFSDMLNKTDLIPGSMVEICTQNSVYELLVLDDEDFLVSGGWFDKANLSPYLVRINGCTWGGSAIKHDIIAGTMMYLEFNMGNRTIVTTSSIKSWRVHDIPAPEA